MPELMWVRALLAAPSLNRDECATPITTRLERAHGGGEALSRGDGAGSVGSCADEAGSGHSVVDLAERGRILCPRRRCAASSVVVDPLWQRIFSYGVGAVVTVYTAREQFGLPL